MLEQIFSQLALQRDTVAISKIASLIAQ